MANTNLIWDKLLESVFMLLGLAIVNLAISIGLPYLLSDFFTDEYLEWREYLRLLMRLSFWIGQIGFGLVIYYKLRHIRVAASIGLLSVVLPIFGTVLFLITSTIFQPQNEQ